MSRRRLRTGEELEKRLLRKAVRAGNSDTADEPRGAAVADPIDALVGSLDLESADVDDVVYPAKPR